MAYYQQPAQNPAYQARSPYGDPEYGGYAQPPPSRYNNNYPGVGYSHYQDAEAGRYGKPYGEARVPFQSERHPNLRNAFLRKIYTTLSLQLALTALIASAFAFHRPMQRAVLTNPQGYLFGGTIPGFVILMALSCFQQTYPLNALLLFLFTLCQSVVVGTLCAVYSAAGLGSVVVTAAGLTAAIFLGLTIYIHTTNTDFSFLSGFLMAGMLVMCLWGFLNLIFGWQPSFLYSAVGALLFCGMILFDTSMILQRYGYDDHIAACIALYLDVINLFMYILQLLASNSRSNDR